MKLREARINKGLNHKEISVLLGIARSTYTKYENEINNPDIKTIIKLAEILEVSTDYLLNVNTQCHLEKDPLVKEIVNKLIILSKENKEKVLDYVEMIYIVENVNNK